MEISQEIINRVERNKKRTGLTEKITKLEPPSLKIFQTASSDTLTKSKSVWDECVVHGKFERFDVLMPSGSWEEGKCYQCEEDERTKELQAKHDNSKNINDDHIAYKAEIPKRFFAKTFDNYNADTPKKKVALSVCMKYADKFDSILEKGICLTLCGKPGTGKTHLACAIAMKVGETFGRNILFLGVYRAISQIKSTFSGGELTEQEVYKNFADLDLLILDEVGVQFGTKTEELILFEIINRRYEEMKPTIIISNLQVDELKDFIGERVMDRIREGGGPVIAFDWESFRK